MTVDNVASKINHVKTDFFRVNHVSKRQFANQLISDIGTKLAQMLVNNKETQVNTGKVKILFLSSNPLETQSLRLDEEIREIENKILLAQKKDKLILIKKGAVRAEDLQFYLNQEEPTIVHFSGHGTSEGEIVLEDFVGNPRTVSPEALKRLFKILKDDIRCVVLNACFSYEQALAISQHIDCVIGMSSFIGDKAAIAFSQAFYLAIASERSIKNAFDQGITELMLRGIPEECTPRLICRRSINPSKVFLLS